MKLSHTTSQHHRKKTTNNRKPDSLQESLLVQSIDTILEQGMLSPFIVHSFLVYEKKRQKHESKQTS